VPLFADRDSVIELLEGGADFAATAQEKSTGPSGPSGGELGWFGPGMMVPEFEAAVIELEAGAVSAPVQTQFGWHVVKLNETRTSPLPTLDDLRAELTTEVQQEELNTLLETLSAAADVTLPEEGAFDPSLIQNIDLLVKFPPHHQSPGNEDNSCSDSKTPPVDEHGMKETHPFRLDHDDLPLARLRRNSSSAYSKFPRTSRHNYRVPLIPSQA